MVIPVHGMRLRNHNNRMTELLVILFEGTDLIFVIDVAMPFLGML